MAEEGGGILWGDGVEGAGDSRPQGGAGARARAAQVRAPARRRYSLTLAKACSMGEKSGEYAGRDSSRQPRVAMRRAASASLWQDRLSRRTTWPGRRCHLQR